MATALIDEIATDSAEDAAEQRGSVAFDTDSVIIPTPGCREDTPIACLIDEFNFDFKNGVTARAFNKIYESVVLPDDVVITFGETLLGVLEDKDADDKAEATGEDETIEEDEAAEEGDIAEEGDVTDADDQARRLQDEEVTIEGDDDEEADDVVDVKEDPGSEEAENKETWTAGSRRVGMTFINTSTIDDSTGEYGQIKTVNLLLEGDSIEDQLHRAMNVTYHEFFEAKKAME